MRQRTWPGCLGKKVFLSLLGAIWRDAVLSLDVNKGEEATHSHVTTVRPGGIGDSAGIREERRKMFLWSL